MVDQNANDFIASSRSQRPRTHDEGKPTRHARRANRAGHKGFPRFQSVGGIDENEDGGLRVDLATAGSSMGLEPPERKKPMSGIFSLVYVVVGFFVSQNHGYIMFDTLPHAVSAGAAILLWPLLFLGVNLQFGS